MERLAHQPGRVGARSSASGCRCLRAKLGESYREASAAFIWATIQRLYAARRTGLKKEMFGYVPGGYARILERFAEVLGARASSVRLGAAVASHRGGRQPGAA